MGGASFGLHLVLLAALPGFVDQLSPLSAQVLDVVLVRPEKPPIESAEAPVPPVPDSPKSASAPKRTPQETKRRRVPSQPGPDLRSESAKPSPSADAFPMEPTPPAPITMPSPPVPTSPAPGPPAPSLALQELTPPAFNASYLRNPPPRYPPIARRNGEQGTVTLRVLVTQEGVPVRVNVEQTSGSRHLDTAALEAVKTWRFVPARRGAEPVEAWVLVPIVFRLEGAS